MQVLKTYNNDGGGCYYKITENEPSSLPIENNNEEKISYESESLKTVILEENALTDSEAPFLMGGDSNE